MGLVENLDAEAELLSVLLDEALNGSLWSRQIARFPEGTRERQMSLFRARGTTIWNVTTPQQRRGHFAMGVGLEPGLIIDEMAETLADTADRADEAALTGEVAVLQEAVTNLGTQLLRVRPFAPEEELPEGWEGVLSAWLLGESMESVGAGSTNLVENVFTYRLVWALEAVRVRRIVGGWAPSIAAGAAAACVETGLPQLGMAALVRAGLPLERPLLL